MQAFVKEDDVDRISFGDDWVDIRRHVSYGEVEDLPEGDALAMSEGKTSVPLLMMCIVSWSFKFNESDEEPLPVTVENLRKLKLEVAARIVKDVEKRIPLG